MQNLIKRRCCQAWCIVHDILHFSCKNSKSMWIDPKFFTLANNLEEVNAFPWGVLSWEATRDTIYNTVENIFSSKRRTLKKVDKVHYTISGFPHTLVILAYSSIPTIAGKFTTKHVEAISRMLSRTSTDNVKFVTVMSALTIVGEKHVIFILLLLLVSIQMLIIYIMNG